MAQQSYSDKKTTTELHYKLINDQLIGDWKLGSRLLSTYQKKVTSRVGGGKNWTNGNSCRRKKKKKKHIAENTDN